MEMDETPNEMLLATHAREGYFGLPTPVKNSLHILRAGDTNRSNLWK